MKGELQLESLPMTNVSGMYLKLALGIADGKSYGHIEGHHTQCRPTYAGQNTRF